MVEGVWGRGRWQGGCGYGVRSLGKPVILLADGKTTMIKQLSIRNFKSIGDQQDIPMGPLVVLVGPNASGKSSIIESLALLKATSEYPLRVALERFGGYESAVWGGEMGRNIAFGVASGDAHYELEMTYEGEPVVASEELSDGYEHFGRRGGFVYEGPVYEDTDCALDLGRSRLEQYPEFAGKWPAAFGRWAFHHFHPRDMRAAQRIEKQYLLSETGDNLSTVLHTLFSDGDLAFDEIGEFLKGIVPTVERLLSPIHGQAQTYAAIREKGVPNLIGSRAMSYGTLFGLALGTALISPKPASLIAIEAPDTELHPYLMENVAEALLAASERSQVIVTTHSPYLLDHLPAESVIVVEKENGMTQCRPIGSSKELKKVIEMLGAGDAWYSGHLGGVP